MVKYVYPHLPSVITTPFIRYSGSGLGNSLFVFARALVFAEDHNLQMINPTWLNFDPVQWKLWSKDKRTYNDIFDSVGITGIKRLFVLTFGKKIKEENYGSMTNRVGNLHVDVDALKGQRVPSPGQRPG